MLDPLLRQFGQTTDPSTLRALVEALRALAGKVTDAQASQALDPLLRQIGQTTDYSALRALADALQALAGKLTEAQASQALDPLLRQIGQTKRAPRAGECAPGSRGEADWTHGRARRSTRCCGGSAETADSGALRALAQALQALGAS